MLQLQFMSSIAKQFTTSSVQSTDLKGSLYFLFLVLESLGNLSFKFQELDCSKVFIIKIFTFDFPYQSTNNDLT